MYEYSPKTWLALEIFAVIFHVWTMSRSSLPVVTNLLNSTALHEHTGSFRFSCLRWYKLFIDE